MRSAWTSCALSAHATAGRAVLVAGCNAGATRQSVALATAARDLGYDAVMLAAPATSLPQQHELAAHFVAVAESAGLPVILYNYPARAGVEIGLECLDLVAGHPLIVGLKESSGDFSRLLTVLHRYAGELTIMCGSDDQAADYFFWGVRGLARRDRERPPPPARGDPGGRQLR